jgi:hypothetical protein
MDAWFRQMDQDPVIGLPFHIKLRHLRWALTRSRKEHPLPTLDDPNYRGPAW